MKVTSASASAGNAAAMAERTNGSFSSAATTNELTTPCVAAEVVGEAQRRVDAAVERALEIGDPPGDRAGRERLGVGDVQVADRRDRGGRRVAPADQPARVRRFDPTAIVPRPGASGRWMMSPTVARDERSSTARSRGTRDHIDRLGEKNGSPARSQGWYGHQLVKKSASGTAAPRVVDSWWATEANGVQTLR